MIITKNKIFNKIHYNKIKNNNKKKTTNIRTKRKKNKIFLKTSKMMNCKRSNKQKMIRNSKVLTEKISSIHLSLPLLLLHRWNRKTIPKEVRIKQSNCSEKKTRD